MTQQKNIFGDKALGLHVDNKRPALTGLPARSGSWLAFRMGLKPSETFCGSSGWIWSLVEQEEEPYTTRDPHLFFFFFTATVEPAQGIKESLSWIIYIKSRPMPYVLRFSNNFRYVVHKHLDAIFC